MIGTYWTSSGCSSLPGQMSSRKKEPVLVQSPCRTHVLCGSSYAFSGPSGFLNWTWPPPLSLVPILVGQDRAASELLETQAA